MGKTVNEIFKKIVLSMSAGGPRPQHFSPGGLQATRYPNFVLQLKMPEDKFDILIDPDKSTIVFKDSDQVKKCALGLLLELFQLHSPTLKNRLSSYLPLQQQRNAHTVDLESVPLVAGAINEATIDLDKLDIPLATVLNSATRRNDMCAGSAEVVSFESAWGDLVNDQLSVSTNVESIADVTNINIYVDREVVLSRSPDLYTSYFDNVLLPEREALVNEISPDYLCAEQGKYSASSGSNNFDTLTKDVECSSDSTDEIYIQKSFKVANLDQDFTVTATDKNSKLFNSIIITESSTVTKEQLNNIEFVCQVESKYLVGVVGSMIVAFDQHAADERIKLEQFGLALELGRMSSGHDLSSIVNVSSKELYAFRPFQPLLSEDGIGIDSTQVETIRRHVELLEAWGFRYAFPSCMTKNAPQDPLIVLERKHQYSSSCMHKSKDQEYTLKVTHTPVVLSEQLITTDFVEFIDALLSVEVSAALSPVFVNMHKPPAVHRILCSKSCRNAIKFGDRLSDFDGRHIIRQLAKATVPFQCAHGRPTLCPLAKMPFPSTAANEYKRPDYTALLRKYKA